jgi:hypothetical protein
VEHAGNPAQTIKTIAPGETIESREDVMKKTAIVIAMLLTFIAAGTCLADGTVTVGAPQMIIVNQSSCAGNAVDNIKKTITISWTGDISDGTILPTLIPSTGVLGWYLYTVETVPGGTAPTNGYGITIRNSNGIDLMDGILANRSASAAQLVNAGAGAFGYPLVMGDLTFAISGNSIANSTGTVILTFLPE